MYNYYSYLKQLKESQSKESILTTDNDFRKKIITKNKLIENNTKKLKQEVFKLSQEPIIIHKYRDAPSTYFNSNKIKTDSTPLVKNEKSTILQVKSLDFNCLRQNEVLYQQNNVPQNIETPKIIEYQNLKFIKKPESDLERLYNSIVKFFREESNFRIVKNYCFPLGNKLRNYKNNSAFEEFYKTSKRCKQDLIPLLKDLLNSEVYIRESKENSLLNGSIHIILKFLEDNKTRFIIHSAQAKNESDEESQDDRIITKPIKFIRNKYFKLNSKLKPYIVNNAHLYDEKEEGIMSDYLTGNRDEVDKMKAYCKNKERAMSSYNLTKSQKVDKNKYKEEHSKIHFKSIASYMYQLEKENNKDNDKNNLQSNASNISHSSISKTKMAKSSSTFFITKKNPQKESRSNSSNMNTSNFISKYNDKHIPEVFLEPLDQKLKAEFRQTLLYNAGYTNSNTSNDKLKDNEDLKKVSNLLQTIEFQEKSIGSKINSNLNSPRARKKSNFADESPYIIVNKKSYKEKELHKAIKVLLDKCLKHN